MDVVTMFSNATARGCDVMSAVSVEQLILPTPCSQWTVQELIDHMVGSTEYLLAGLESRAPAPVVGATASDYAVGRSRVLEGLAETGALQRVCKSPFGPDWTMQEATAGTSMENVIHTWDLATATGQDATIDSDLVDACVAMFLPDMPIRGRASGLVGPEVPIDGDATPQERLLAAMGRRA